MDRAILFAAAATAAVSAVVSIGCGDGGLYGCPDPNRPCTAPDAGPLPDAGLAAIPLLPPAPKCAGTCVPPPADDWSAPLLLWTGSPDSIPDCPPEAPHRAYDGVSGLMARALSCETCLCSPPSGTCGPPTSLTTSSTATCSGPWSGDFDPPPAWDGSCSAANAVPAGETCGGEACVQSVSIGALSLTETDCTPMMPPPAPGPPDPGAVTWQNAARACVDLAPGPCGGAGEVCAPAGAEGFVACVQGAGDAACPEGWPDRRVFYDGADDGRGCSPCTCGQPAGGACSGLVSLYSDGACSALVDAVSVVSGGPTCVEAQPKGVALGSKDVTMLTYAPGACAPAGGDPTGAVTPLGPTTFCCRM